MTRGMHRFKSSRRRRADSQDNAEGNLLINISLKNL